MRLKSLRAKRAKLSISEPNLIRVNKPKTPNTSRAVLIKVESSKQFLSSENGHINNKNNSNNNLNDLRKDSDYHHLNKSSYYMRQNKKKYANSESAPNDTALRTTGPSSPPTTNNYDFTTVTSMIQNKTKTKRSKQIKPFMILSSSDHSSLKKEACYSMFD